MGMQSLKSIFCQWPFQQPIYWRYLPYNNVSVRGYTSKFYGSKYGTWCLQSIAELAMDVATLPLRPVVTCNLSPRPVPVLSLYPRSNYILYILLYIISLCYIYTCISVYSLISHYVKYYIYMYTHTCIYMYGCTFPKLAMTCRNGDRKTQYSDPLKYIWSA